MTRTLLVNARIATLRGGRYSMVDDAAMRTRGGRIEWLGPARSLAPRPGGDGEEVFDARGALVTPGLVDCHTHLVYAGDRAADFEMRLAGASYADIARAGGGIVSTVKATRAASNAELRAVSAKRLEALMAEGVTTVEIKSGYGLDVENELRCLRIARSLAADHGVSICTTLLGAHALPPEFAGRADDYIDAVCTQMIPRAAAEGLASAVDAFCETIAFSNAQVRRVFEAARAHGLAVKLHADQLSDSGGAALAARFGALSADHLEHAGEEGVAALAAAATVAVLLPGAYYFKSGEQHSINSATYLLPPGLPGAVILDATANNDVLYQMLKGRVYIAPIPPNVRDYSNVTLHVARTGSGLGKSVTDDTKHLRLPRLAKRLSEEIAPGRSVFLCVHKHSEALAETFSTDRLNLSVGYWGAIDGKNTWQDCDVAVIYGLPYMDQRRAINSLFATHGPQETAWLRANTHKQQVNLVNVIMQRHLSTSVVQAINRICCRRVIDDQGRCPVSDVYILLPKHWQGDAILGDIQGNMPGINVVPWDYEPDGPKVYAPRSSSASAAIISLMRSRAAGMTPLPYIQDQLSLSVKQIRRIKEQLLNGESNIAKALREIGVSYHVTGVGRGSKSFLVKA
jgi:imidazolonepropionase